MREGYSPQSDARAASFFKRSGLAVFSSVPANSVVHFCCQSRIELNHRKNALFILKPTESVSTRLIIRVSLFTSATVVFRDPRRDSSFCIYRPRLSSRFFTHRITALAPWIMRVMRLRLPFFVTETAAAFHPNCADEEDVRILAQPEHPFWRKIT